MPTRIKLTSTPNRGENSEIPIPATRKHWDSYPKHPKAKPLIMEVTMVITMPIFFLHQIPQATSGYVDKYISKVTKNLCSCILWQFNSVPSSWPKASDTTTHPFLWECYTKILMQTDGLMMKCHYTYTDQWGFHCAGLLTWWIDSSNEICRAVLCPNTEIASCVERMEK